MLTKDKLPTCNISIQQAVTYCALWLFNDKYDYVFDYDVKLSSGKNLQRPLVWTLEQKQNLILSMLKDITLPDFHVALYKPKSTEEGTTKETYFRIIDGKQRLTTIQDFITDKFAIVINNESFLFSDFDSFCKHKLANARLNFKIAYEYDDCRFSDRDLIDWFYMVNFAGTQQDKEHIDDLYKLV